MPGVWEKPIGDRDRFKETTNLSYGSIIDIFHLLV